ncbi:MAG: cyclase/dehydrase [uncultured Thermomicrobiales bacterium]|uniref:Cyclase/dehydrase n=1 Tax=uncultured Thermomicrobiales bacterium TaxID=1645740 RepID=A0A6J4V6N4_9BACT|nr:MAG: cyclase/dehydrase [uncultured Thermomicrobiales bacterium]
MAEVKSAVEVKVPIRTAYNQWTQFAEFPQFMDGVVEVHQLDDKRLHWRAKIAGKEEAWEAEITEQVPDQRIAWKSTTGASNSGTVAFHYLDPNTTRVTLQIAYEPDGTVEKIGSALGFPQMRVDGDLKRFKAFIETTGQETGAWRGEIGAQPKKDQDDKDDKDKKK